MEKQIVRSVFRVMFLGIGLCSIGHDVYGERGHVCRPDYASDGKRVAKLVTTLF